MWTKTLIGDVYMKFYDIKKKEPKLSVIGKEESFSDQLLLYIDGKMYLGHYFETNGDKGFEIAVYESVDLYSMYQMSTMITQDNFDDYEIYWCEIDMDHMISIISTDLDMEDDENATS
jgi:hypothetical protein